MTRYGIYLRRSSPGEDDKNTSIETQEADCRAAVEQRGGTVAKVYRDPGGRSYVLERPKLVEAMVDARKGEFDALIVWKFDRFSRNQIQQNVARYQFLKYGAEVYSATEPVMEGTMGDMQRNMYTFAAEVELNNIRVRMWTGRRRRVERGNLPGGPNPLYGYQWADREREGDRGRFIADLDPIDSYPDHAPARVIQRIFRLASENHSIRQIAETLEADGVPTPAMVLHARGQLPRGRAAGASWNTSVISRILRDYRYAGRYVAFNWALEETKGRDRNTGEVTLVRRQRVREEDDEARVLLPEGTVEPLVTEQQIKAVQAALAARKKNAFRRTAHPDGAILRGGLSRCVYCGHTVSAAFHRTRGYYQYRCNPSAQKGNNLDVGCPGPRWNRKAEEIDDLVWRWLLRQCREPDRLRAQYDQWCIERDQGMTLETDRRAVIDSLIAKEEKRRKNLLRLAELAQDDSEVDEFAGQMRDARKKIARLHEERAELERTLALDEQQKEAVNAYVNLAQNALHNLFHADYERKRDMLQAFGVTVHMGSSKQNELLRIEWKFAGVRQAFGNLADPTDAGMQPAQTERHLVYSTTSDLEHKANFPTFTAGWDEIGGVLGAREE